jgi:cobalt/nickel transport system ATP-binding protein
MNDPDIIFDLQQVGYSYSDLTPVLCALDFRVHRGESVAILGANGCGKSTLLGLMNGLLFATEGVVQAYGQRLTEDKLAREDFAHFFRSRVGFVFQNPDIQLFCPTAWDEVCFGPLQLGLSPEEVRERAVDVLALLGIEHLRERAPFSLSGGEKKKVAIASVLSMNTEVLLLDEPESGLDPRTQAWFIEFLRQLHSHGKTLIAATHDLSMVDEVASRIVVLDESHRLIADDATDEILSDQELLFKANLVHEHIHHHGGVTHRHLHSHVLGHRHPH